MIFFEYYFITMCAVHRLILVLAIFLLLSLALFVLLHLGISGHCHQTKIVWHRFPSKQAFKIN